MHHSLLAAARLHSSAVLSLSFLPLKVFFRSPSSFGSLPFSGCVRDEGWCYGVAILSQLMHAWRSATELTHSLFHLILFGCCSSGVCNGGWRQLQVAYSTPDRTPSHQGPMLQKTSEASVEELVESRWIWHPLVNWL